MRIKNYSEIRKCLFFSAAYYLFGFFSVCFGIRVLFLLFYKFYLKQSVTLQSFLVSLGVSVAFGLSSFLLWHVLKGYGSKDDRYEPFVIDCQHCSFPSLARTINKTIPLRRQKNVEGVLYGVEKLKKKRITVFLFDFTDGNEYKKDTVHNTIREINQKRSIKLPQTIDEARNRYKVVVYVFPSLPPSAEEEVKSNAVKDIYSWNDTIPESSKKDLRRPPLSAITHIEPVVFSELTVTAFVDLEKSRAFVPACKTDDFLSMRDYSYCLKRLSKWLQCGTVVLGQGTVLCPKVTDSQTSNSTTQN